MLEFPEARMGLYEVLLELCTGYGGLVPPHLTIFLIFPHICYNYVFNADDLCLYHRLARFLCIIVELVQSLD